MEFHHPEKGCKRDNFVKKYEIDGLITEQTE